MNFELGFYRTRDGSIVELTEIAQSYLVGRAVVSTLQHKNRKLYWNENGDATYYVTSLDLFEYLKIKENGRHEGPPLKTYIAENIGIAKELK